MTINRSQLRLFVLIFGSLVPASYYFGFSRLADPSILWGGIPELWRPFIVPWMFVAVIGFFMFTWVMLFTLDTAAIQGLRWPRSAQHQMETRGGSLLLLAYLLFLIPSSLWLETTLLHLNNDFWWTPIIVIGNLGLVAVGNAMFILLAYGAIQNGVKHARVAFVGSLLISVQVILNDFILWSLFFPW